MMDLSEEVYQRVANRMLSMYGTSHYTPEERATDHAFAYDSKEAGRKYWIGVLQAIYRIKEGDSK